jgi:hypothetical protein
MDDRALISEKLFSIFLARMVIHVKYFSYSTPC